jgi:hypothetical protein
LWPHARDGVADERLHVQDHGRQLWPSYGLPGSAFTWVTNWPALAWLIVVALVGPMGLALTLTDAFDFRRMQGIDLRPALTLLLLAHAPRQQ